jgi:putative acetyltransferase
MSQCFIIRKELPADVQAIADITIAAFRSHPHSNHTEQFITAGLRRSGALSLSLVAEAEGQVIGHVAFSPVAIADGSEGWYGLGPLSVAPRFQGHGTGLALVHSGLTLLRERGAHGCVVLGPPKYYERFGFVANPALTLSGPPPELFMSLHFTGPHPQGEVTYHEAFTKRA